MHPEQQAQAKRDEDRIRELDEALHFLNQQLSLIEARLQTALEQVKIINLSTPWPVLSQRFGVALRGSAREREVKKIKQKVKG
jgi:hypothetical protein